MTTIELKKSIIYRIAQIEDLNFLRAINTIIESSKSEAVFCVTDEMKSNIENSRKMAKHGQIVSDIDICGEIEEWLKKEK